MPHQPSDVVIAGAGPAGLALGRALARRGAAVIIADPAPESPWPNRYGAWSADLDGTLAKRLVARRWTRVTARVGAKTRDLPGTYAQVDGQELRNLLRADMSDRRGQIRAGRVVRVEHDAAGANCHLADGETLRTRVMVDATGRGSLVHRRTPPRAFQAAYGLLVRVRHHPWSVDEAMLMDFDRAHLDATARGGPPTFLYALPHSDDVVFVEETSLAAAPAMPLDALRDRLHARLDHLGVEVLETLHVERCLIPMDGSIPKRGRTVAFGAAAGFVHPATGYQLTRTLAASETVADAIVTGLGADPAAASALAWDAAWPAALRRTRALHILGLGLLLSLDAARTAAFFDAFFSLPESRWRAYLDPTSPPGAVASSMARVFATVSHPLRGAIVSHAIGAGRAQLLAALTPQLGGAS